MSDFEIFQRLLVAVSAGAVLGFDREVRGISAGLRTHAMASLGSAVIMVLAMVLYENLTNSAGEPATDPMRAVQGLAQAIGFVAAGAIFFSQGKVHNLTSATNIWLAAGVGIAAGLGEYLIVALAVVFGIVLLAGVRVLERVLPGKDRSEGD